MVVLFSFQSRSNKRSRKSPPVKQIHPHGAKLHDKIVSVRVRSIWLGHGAIAAPLSVVTTALTGNQCAHYWVEIETQNGDYYCAQFTCKKILSLRKCRSSQALIKQYVPAKNKQITDKHCKTIDIDNDDDYNNLFDININSTTTTKTVKKNKRIKRRKKHTFQKENDKYSICDQNVSIANITTKKQKKKQLENGIDNRSQDIITRTRGKTTFVNNNSTKERKKSKTIGDVIQFMENYDGSYHMLLNNCQNFAISLFDWI